MRLLCAALANRNKSIIDLDSIVTRIYEFKNVHPDYGYAFEDMEFRSSIGTVVSSDISEGLNRLQTFGLVGKLNPKFEKLVIYLTHKKADEMLSQYSGRAKRVVLDLAEKF